MFDDLLSFLFEIVCVTTAAILVPVITLGAVRVDVGSRSKDAPWHGVRRTVDGKLAIDSSSAALIGVLFWVGTISAVVWISHHR